MKHLNTYITEYIVKKKLNKFIDSEDHYEYTPKTKMELLDNIQELFDKGETDLNCIDTSNITDMSHLFDSYFNKIPDIKFNFDISGWNVSNVTNMQDMFFNCKYFDCDLSKWNVSNVTNMHSMFYWSDFNGDISNWDVSNVKDMNSMFLNSKFNGDISNWDVSNVDMYNMFKNSPLQNNPPKWYKQ